MMCSSQKRENGGVTHHMRKAHVGKMRKHPNTSGAMPKTCKCECVCMHINTCLYVSDDVTVRNENETNGKI